MYYFGSNGDPSLVAPQKSMLEKEILDIGKESKSFFESTTSLPLSNKE